MRNTSTFYLTTCTHVHTYTQTKQTEWNKIKMTDKKWEWERTEPPLGLATIPWDQALKPINKWAGQAQLTVINHDRKRARERRNYSAPLLSLPPSSEVLCIWPVIYRLYGTYSPVQQSALIQELYLSHRDVFHTSQGERETLWKRERGREW